MKFSTLKKFLFTLLALPLLQSSVFSQAKYSNEFLSIGIGARALGMSNSVLASGNDVTSGYWNPAGLCDIKGDMQVGLMHAEYFAGIAKFDYAAIAKPLDASSTLGFSMVRFGVDDIPNTTELIDADGNIDYDRITRFSAADYAFITSYSRKLNIEGLRVGANFKVIHRKIGDFGKSWGFGLDAGVRYVKGDWHFAAMARDITTTFNAWSYDLTDEMIETFTATGNDIPSSSIELTLPKLLLGASRKINFNDKFSLLTEVNLDLSFDGKRNVLISTNPVSIDPHIGIEAGYRDIVFLRAGLGNIQEVKETSTKNVTTFQPNIGLGINIKRITIDYAMTDIGNVSDALYSHVFSLRFLIYKPTATGGSSL
jgi:hypothetical protein